MKRIATVLCGFLAVSLSSTGYANDVFSKGPPPVVHDSAAYDWTGFYGGIHGGWTSVDVSHFDRFGAGTNLDHDVSGGVIGGQIGFNYQMDNFVIGIEGSFSAADANGSAVTPATRSFDLQSTADVRGRLGYVFADILVYATAGAAFADINVSQFVNSTDADHTGFVVGLGAAWRAMQHVSLGAEYLYADYGNEVYPFGGAPDDVSFETHTIRAVLNLHLPVN